MRISSTLRPRAYSDGYNRLRPPCFPLRSCGNTPSPNNRWFLGCIRQVSRTQSPKTEGDVSPRALISSTHETAKSPSADASFVDSSSKQEAGHPRPNAHSHTSVPSVHTSIHPYIQCMRTYTLCAGGPPSPRYHHIRKTRVFFHLSYRRREVAYVVLNCLGPEPFQSPISSGRGRCGAALR